MKTKKLIFAFFAFFLMLLTGCATTLHVKVKRPSELDMNGANTIAILPFKPAKYYKRQNYSRGLKVLIREFFDFYNDVSSDESICTDYLERKLKESLLESEYLTLINETSVQNAIQYNRNENPADVYLTGEVVRFDVNDERNEYTKKVNSKSDNGSATYVHMVDFTRHVWFEFNYQIVDSKTEQIISYEHVEIKNSSGIYNSPYDLPDAFSVIKYDIEKEAKKIMKRIQPYEILKSITLIDDHLKRDDLKMARELAEDGLYEEACIRFEDIYKSEKIFEAGYNAALLYEVLGDLNTAKKLMTEVLNVTDDPRASKALSDIKNEIHQADRLQSQLDAQSANN